MKIIELTGPSGLGFCAIADNIECFYANTEVSTAKTVVGFVSGRELRVKDTCPEIKAKIAAAKDA